MSATGAILLAVLVAMLAGCAVEKRRTQHLYCLGWCAFVDDQGSKSTVGAHEGCEIAPR